MLQTIGLMSGTSIDGIDVAIAQIAGSVPTLDIEQIAFQTVPWPDHEQTLLFDLVEQRARTADLCRANFMVGERFGTAALEVLERFGIPQHEIDLIGSHGQTLWHDVRVSQMDGESPIDAQDAMGHVTSTLQVGDPSVIAARTGVTTIANFRTADVAVGGQGAPLTSTFDWYQMRPPPNLHGVAGGWRAVQNIGGIANVTFLPPRELNAPPLAFDTGPGNALIDWAVAHASVGRYRYDVDGQIAATGTVNEPLLQTWRAHPYMLQHPPKTTGRELFGIVLTQQWQAQAYAVGCTNADFIATLTELTAATIVDAYQRFAPGPLAEVVVSGGGAANPTLMRSVKTRLDSTSDSKIRLCTHEALGIDSNAKEALAFALLAYLTICGSPGNVPACTGANKNQILGQIAPGENWEALVRKTIETSS